MAYYDDNDERDYSDYFKDKKLGETYKEADERHRAAEERERESMRKAEAEIARQRMNADMDSMNKNDSNVYLSYGGTSRSSDTPVEMTTSGQIVATFGLLMFVTGIVLYFVQTNPPIIWSTPLPKLLCIYGFLFALISAFPKTIAGLLFLGLVMLVYSSTKTPAGFAISAISKNDWNLILVLLGCLTFIFVFLIKK